MGDKQAEIKALVSQAKRQGFSARQTRSGHIHVERDGQLAVVSVSPSANGAVRGVKRDLQRAGVDFNRRRRHSHIVTGIEGELLLVLNASSHALSAHSLASQTGVTIATVLGILKKAELKFPELTHEFGLWSWEGGVPPTNKPIPDTIPLRQFRYPLRTDVTVSILLPQDITKDEMGKVVAWLRWVQTPHRTRR